MTIDRQTIGREGEDLAAALLASRGYTLVERRYRTRMGEIDLIVSRGALLVFVEVKARRGTGFGAPAEAVHPLKQARLARVASMFLAARGLADRPCRFDVVAVTWDPRGRPRCEHIEDAFRPGG